MIFRYVIIPYTAAVDLGLDKYHHQDVDGNVIVSQSDLMAYGYPGDSLEAKAAKLGGEIISANEARIRIATAKNNKQ
jgi:hypothetical protein